MKNGSLSSLRAFLWSKPTPYLRHWEVTCGKPQTVRKVGTLKPSIGWRESLVVTQGQIPGTQVIRAHCSVMGWFVCVVSPSRHGQIGNVALVNEWPKRMQELERIGTNWNEQSRMEIAMMEICP